MGRVDGHVIERQGVAENERSRDVHEEKQGWKGVAVVRNNAVSL